jgi:hypothetical protein
MKYFVLISLFILTPLMAYAQVKTFQNLPGLENVSDLTTQQYIDALFVIAIVTASILAVFKLIWAGVQYMLSEVVTSKQKAKDDIRGALLGLLIILGAVTLLNTINPNLTNLNFLRNATTVTPAQRVGGSRQVEAPTPTPTCTDGRTPSCNQNEFGIQECTCL